MAQHYARIKKGKVREVTTLDPAQYYVATAASWIECPSDVVVNSDYDAEKKTFTAPPAPIDPTTCERILEHERASDALERNKDCHPVRPADDVKFMPKDQ